MRRWFVLACLLVISGAFPQAGTGKEEVNLEFQEETLSAHFNRVPLSAVLERISAEKGIRFEGGKSLLNMEVTVNFTGLPFEEGLKRILEGTSYLLFYEPNGSISKVRLVGPSSEGKGEPVHPGGKVKKVPVPGGKAPVPVAPISKPGELGKAGDSARVRAAGTDEGEIPGGPVEVTPEEKENFRIIENAPPPGGPVGGPDIDSPDFKIIRNAPSPGGP
jgi:hypothetical protein